ncbi:protein-arginine deiminase domain-containing protein, partial [Patescibacteria group bacterium]|nr:protein-arginine deiminase domain-containing protein [Patescibacteria group bacterium]MBU2597477.1 protein-arginine deiminase domain-containing protein [Planctomycetota bacterium]
FDVTVTALPNTQTTSLNGGRLYTTELKLIARIDESIETSKILALAAGDVRKIIQNYSDGVIFVDSDFSSIPDESSRYVRVQNSKMWLELVEGHWVEKPALTCARKILNDGQYLDAQNACRAKINSVKDILNTGLSSPNFVKIPSLFRDGSTDEGFQAVAEMPGMVNMLVIGNRAIIAKPFGPLEYGVDIFEDYVESVLGPIGISVNFVDDWDTYHRMEGEIHCGTNVKRTPHITNWWE